MRDQYDNLIQEGEAGIDRLIAEQTQETLQLDFKRKEVPGNGGFSTNDRRMLAQALSGFSNSAGGLLIVGVDARPGSDHVDCAQAAHPVSEIRRFCSEAHTEVGQLVQPRLDGVTVGMIESERVPNAGYLLVHVERSDRRPHRSEAKGQKGYFKRHGASFYEMEHNDIEDAFARNAACTLEVRKSINLVVRSGEERQFEIRIFLKNTSAFIAKYPYIVIHKMEGCSFIETSGQPLPVERAFGVVSCMAGADVVIHPETERHVATLRANLVRHATGEWRLKSNPESDEIAFEFVYGCEAARAMRYQEQVWMGPFIT